MYLLPRRVLPLGRERGRVMDFIPLTYKQGLTMVSTSKIHSAAALVTSFIWFLPTQQFLWLVSVKLKTSGLITTSKKSRDPTLSPLYRKSIIHKCYQFQLAHYLFGNYHLFNFTCIPSNTHPSKYTFPEHVTLLKFSSGKNFISKAIRLFYSSFIYCARWGLFSTLHVDNQIYILGEQNLVLICLTSFFFSFSLIYQTIQMLSYLKCIKSSFPNVV